MSKLSNSEQMLTGAPGEFQRILAEPAFFKEVFDLIPMQILVKSARPENFGTFLLQNSASVALLGLENDELIGKSDADFFPPDQVAFFREKDEEVMAGGCAVNIPIEQVTSRTLGLRLLQTTKVPIYDDFEKPLALVVVSQDITERVADERTLAGALKEMREDRDLIQTLIDSLPIFVFAKYADPGRKGQYILWNKALEKFFGIAASDVVGRPGRAVLPEASAELSAAEDEEVIRSRQTVRKVGKVERNYLGEKRIVDSLKTPVFGPGGNLFAIVGCAEDVTERRFAELQHQRMANLVYNVNRRIPGAIYQVRIGEDGSRSFVYISEGIEEILGLSVEEILEDGSRVYELIHPDDVERFAAAEAEAVEGLKPFSYEFRTYDTKGNIHWLLANSAPFVEDGRATVWSGHVSDITERKAFEEELMRARDVAERANLAKDRFLAMMSHEIRTPLNGILGFAELLSNSGLPREHQSHIETIVESGSSLLAILNDILDFSKFESDVFHLSVEPVNLCDLIASAHQAYFAIAQEKGIQLASGVTGTVPTRVLCDPLRFRQILNNLLSNALKFTAQGSVRLLCEVDAGDQDGTVGVCIKVSDSGIGIPASEFQRLFSPFEQLEDGISRNFSGTGLGLAIVRKLVDAMGGTIGVSSEVGKGSTFEVRVSMNIGRDSMNDENQSDETPDPKSNLTGLRILVVEDNAINRRLASLMLERIGVHVVLAESGLEAISQATAQPIDLILMDIQMPGMDGYETAEKLREIDSTSTIPIIALTAHAMGEDRKKSEEKGFAHHLTKPFKIDELRKVLEDVAPRASGKG